MLLSDGVARQCQSVPRQFLPALNAATLVGRYEGPCCMPGMMWVQLAASVAASAAAAVAAAAAEQGVQVAGHQGPRGAGVAA
jgi:hypothetical protein